MSRVAKGRAVLHCPEDLLHLAAFGQLVYELVEVADLAGEGVVDLLDAVTADHAFDECCIGVDGGLLKEGGKGGFVVDECLQAALVEAREPLNDLVQLGYGSALFLHFGDVVRVDGGKGHVGNALVVLWGDFHGLIWLGVFRFKIRNFA